VTPTTTCARHDHLCERHDERILARIGATIVSDRIYEPFKHGNTSFYHGGHPVSSAVAPSQTSLISSSRRRSSMKTCASNSLAFRSTLEKLEGTCLSSEMFAEPATSSASSW
jgi:adenosylmethionine-8-amino-7-oxononanoate aminotransferase